MYSYIGVLYRVSYPTILQSYNILQCKYGAVVCMCLQSEWFVQALTSPWDSSHYSEFTLQRNYY